jgi:hypothetical protein
MSVMRGIAFRWPVGLACLPDDMMIGEPSGFNMCAVEKISQPLAALTDDSAHVRSPIGAWPVSHIWNRAQYTVSVQHDAFLGAATEVTVALDRGGPTAVQRRSRNLVPLARTRLARRVTLLALSERVSGVGFRAGTVI